MLALPSESLNIISIFLILCFCLVLAFTRSKASKGPDASLPKRNYMSNLTRSVCMSEVDVPSGRPTALYMLWKSHGPHIIRDALLKKSHCFSVLSAV